MGLEYGLMAASNSLRTIVITSGESFPATAIDVLAALCRDRGQRPEDPPGAEKIQLKDTGLAFLMWGRSGLLPDKLVRVDFTHRNLSGAVEILVCDPDCFFPTSGKIQSFSKSLLIELSSINHTCCFANYRRS